MSEQEIIKILSENGDLMQPYNLLGSFLRWLGWNIVKGLKWIVDGASAVIDDIYSMFGFANSEQVNTFLDKFMPFIFILFGIALVFLGYRFILHSHSDQKSNIATNVVLILVILTCTNVFFAQMTELTQAGVKDLNKTYKNGSYSDTLIKENVADLVYLDSIDFKYKNGATLNKIKAGNFKHLEMGDTVNPDDYDLNSPDVFENKLIVNPSDGSWIIKEIKHGSFNLFPPLYYRYHVSWVTILLTMLSLAIVLIFTIYKLGRIAFEIGFHKILGLIFAVTDIYEGRRMKEIFKSVMSLFAVIIIVNLLLKFYFLFVAYAKVQYDNDSIGALSYGLLLLIAALAVIDGPNVIERVIGVDAGIKSGYQTIVGGMAIGRGLQGLGRGIRDAAVGNPFYRPSSVNEDGTIQRNLGGIAGVVQRMGRHGSSTPEPAASQESGASGMNASPDASGFSPDTPNNTSTTDDPGQSVNGIYDANSSIDSNSIHGEVSDVGVSDENINSSAQDINHQSDRKIDRSGLDALKTQDPIRSSLLHSPSGNDKSPHAPQKDSEEKIRHDTLTNGHVSPTPSTLNNTDNPIEQNQSISQEAMTGKTNSMGTSAPPRQKPLNKEENLLSGDSSFERKESLRIKKEEKKYE